MLLSEIQFKATFGNKMVDVTETAEPVVDIWPYVNQLVQIVPELIHTAESGVVDNVYRNSIATFDHVVLPTSRKGVVCVIVVDIKAANVFGHHLLDMNELYGLS